MYRQLAGVLRERILGGELAAGQRMPSEKDLHDEFGLARETVRRALAILRSESLVEVRHGHGTFVAEAPGRIELCVGDSATSAAALTVTRANGEVEAYPAGTVLVVTTMGAAVDGDRPVIAAAVVLDQGKVLMVRRRVKEGGLSWQFPAGEVELGESGDEAAVRETLEETSLTVRATKQLGGRVHPNTGRTMLYVACDRVAGTAELADDEELAEVAWCDRATLAAYVPYPLFAPVQEYLDANLR